MTNHSLPNQVISSVKCNHCHEVILAFRGTATFDLAQIVRDHAVKENCRPHYGRIAESIRNFSNHVDRLEQAEGVR